MKFIKMIHVFAFVLLYSTCNSEDNSPKEIIVGHAPITGSRIAWDYSTLQRLVPQNNRNIGGSGYSRMIKLANEDYMCVYEVDGQIECIRSTNQGASWEEPLVVAPKVDGVARAVPEIIQLSDGAIIISYNPRPSWSNEDNSKKFGIALKISQDSGDSWSNELIVYEASYQPTEGCWEPNIIELPSGELHLYFANEKNFSTTNEQNITLLRSQDMGLTWSAGETISYSATSRDGMPVALLLEDSNEIIVAIEDNRFNNFKPTIVRTDLSDNWGSGFVVRDAKREYAMSDNLNDATYQGAPYIRKLPSGNVILSYQGTDNRGNHDIKNATMQVVVGDKTGRNFKNKTQPFNVPIGKSALWNSLSVLDGRVWAIASTNAFSGGRPEVWTIAGHEINDYKLPQRTVIIDGKADLDIDFPFFIGAKGSSNASVYVSADEDQLYFIAKVNTATVNPQDGLTFCIDPQNLSTTFPVSGIYAITISANGNVVVKEGFNGKWQDSQKELNKIVIEETTDGYILEFSFDWSVIGGKPERDSRIGFGLSLLNSGVHIEDLVLCNPDKPYTWVTLYR